MADSQNLIGKLLAHLPRREYPDEVWVYVDWHEPQLKLFSSLEDALDFANESFTSSKEWYKASNTRWTRTNGEEIVLLEVDDDGFGYVAGDLYGIDYYD